MTDDFKIDPVKFGQMKQQIDDIHGDVLEIKGLVMKQNGRVRKLENWRSYTIGIVVAVGSIATVIIKFVL